VEMRGATSTKALCVEGEAPAALRADEELKMITTKAPD